jgi:hypothetical protein
VTCRIAHPLGQRSAPRAASELGRLGWEVHEGRAGQPRWALASIFRYGAVAA